MPKLTQLSILLGLINEYQCLVGANLRWISVPSRGSQRLSSGLTVQIPEISAGSMGHLARDLALEILFNSV